MMAMARGKFDLSINDKGLSEFHVLAGSFKRVRNIVKDNSDTSVDGALFVEDAEKQLWGSYLEVKEKAVDGSSEGKYLELLENMLVLKDPVDRFFDEVMVMAEDEDLRKNRLNMMTAIGSLILEVGDISKMHAG